LKIIGIDHIGIAVKSIDRYERFYTELLGLKLMAHQEVSEMALKAKFFKMGDAVLELMEPVGENGPTQQHLKHLGEGVQHIALKVEDFDLAVSELKKAGAWLVGEPKTLDGRKVCFIHPVITGGVVLELIETESQAKYSEVD
jgi:methylmalonyl-CoA epimerase